MLELPIAFLDSPEAFPDNGIREPEFYGDRFMFEAGQWPMVFEDEGYEEMGDSRPHETAERILFSGLEAHFRKLLPTAELLENINFYYHPENLNSYVSPDIMIVDPPSPLSEELRSYRLGATGPAPFLTVEVLSKETHRQGDFGLKPILYASFGVQEYLLVDSTGKFLRQRLLLKKRVGDERWDDEYDTGSGVVSSYGFRVAFDADRKIRVYDHASGRPYPRPNEADEIAMERDELALERDEADRYRAAAEARVRELEAELARLRGENPKAN